VDALPGRAPFAREALGAAGAGIIVVTDVVALPVGAGAPAAPAADAGHLPVEVPDRRHRVGRGRGAGYLHPPPGFVIPVDALPGRAPVAREALGAVGAGVVVVAHVVTLPVGARAPAAPSPHAAHRPVVVPWAWSWGGSGLRQGWGVRGGRGLCRWQGGRGVQVKVKAPLRVGVRLKDPEAGAVCEGVHAALCNAKRVVSEESVPRALVVRQDLLDGLTPVVAEDPVPLAGTIVPLVDHENVAVPLRPPRDVDAALGSPKDEVVVDDGAPIWVAIQLVRGPQETLLGGAELDAHHHELGASGLEKHNAVLVLPRWKTALEVGVAPEGRLHVAVVVVPPVRGERLRHASQIVIAWHHRPRDPRGLNLVPPTEKVVPLPGSVRLLNNVTNVDHGCDVELATLLNDPVGLRDPLVQPCTAVAVVHDHELRVGDDDHSEVQRLTD